MNGAAPFRNITSSISTNGITNIFQYIILHYSKYILILSSKNHFNNRKLGKQLTSTAHHFI